MDSSAGTVLGFPKIYVDFWGWDGSKGDIDGEILPWLDYLQNLGGSRWLETVTQYKGHLGHAAGNPNDLFAGEWFHGSIADYPGPCTTNYECYFYGVGSDLCNPSGNGGQGVCYPSRYDIQNEITRVENYFNPVDDAIIVIAMPPDVPLPQNYPDSLADLRFLMRHDSTPRSGHSSITYIEAPYQGHDATWMLHHEIAEAITDPRYSEHPAFQDECGCEIADKCHPPPPGHNVLDKLRVGESPDPTRNYLVESLWSDKAFGGLGQCVMSSTFHQDYFFTACGGHLRHFTPWGDTGTEDWGYPSGVLLNKDDHYLRGPGAVAYGRGRLDAFAVDQNGYVEHAYRPIGGSVQWYDWGRPNLVLYSPDAFSRRPGTFQVAVTASYGSFGVSLYHRYNQNGSLSNWLGWDATAVPAIGSRPAVASWGYSRIDVFVTTGVGGNVYHGWSNSADPAAPLDGWESWDHPDGVDIGPYIDAASWGDQEVDVFVQGSDGHIYRRQLDHGTLGPWLDYYYPSTGVFSRDFGIGSWGGGDTYVGMTGVSDADGKLYEETVNGIFIGNSWLGMSPNYAACSGVDAAAW